MTFCFLFFLSIFMFHAHTRTGQGARAAGRRHGHIGAWLRLGVIVAVHGRALPQVTHHGQRHS
jgi:hypothetical protein